MDNTIKTKIELTPDQMATLYCGLRYCELNHPTTDIKEFPHRDYRKDFKQLFNDILKQENQTKLL